MNTTQLIEQARQRADDLRNVVDPALAYLAGVICQHPWETDDAPTLPPMPVETDADRWERGMNEGMQQRRERP